MPSRRRRLLRAGVREDSVANLFGEVQRLCDPQRLLVVPKALTETLLQGRVERLFACVTERRVAHVVAEPDCLDEVFVEPQRPRDAAGDRGRLERVRHPRAVVIACGIDEDLGLALQAPKGLRVQDPVAVALERRAQAAIVLGLQPATRLVRPHGQRRQPASFVFSHLRLERFRHCSCDLRHHVFRLDDDRDSSTVGAPGGTCHVGSPLRAEKCNNRGDLLRLGEAAERTTRSDGLEYF